MKQNNANLYKLAGMIAANEDLIVTATPGSASHSDWVDAVNGDGGMQREFPFQWTIRHRHLGTIGYIIIECGPQRGFTVNVHNGRDFKDSFRRLDARSAAKMTAGYIDLQHKAATA
jgi:hypothetical protein